MTCSPYPKWPQLPGWPSGLNAELAAAYVGLGKTAFLYLVAAKCAPEPVRPTPGRRVWLRRALDDWLEGMVGGSADCSPGTGNGEEWMQALNEIASTPAGRSQ